MNKNLLDFIYRNLSEEYGASFLETEENAKQVNDFINKNILNDEAKPIEETINIECKFLEVYSDGQKIAFKQGFKYAFKLYNELQIQEE